MESTTMRPCILGNHIVRLTMKKINNLITISSQTENISDLERHCNEMQCVVVEY